MGTVHHPSAMALHLTMSDLAGPISTGTGIVLSVGETNWLVTAGHNFTGEHPGTGERLNASGRRPTEVGIRSTWFDTLGQWTTVSRQLVDEEREPLWVEHPSLGRRVDVVALRLDEWPNTATLYPLAIEAPGLAHLTVADDVSIIGYPFGITGGEGFPIWSRGTIATELDFDHDALPMFLIDSRTRPGQSGSPVMWYSSHGMIPVEGGWQLNDGTAPPLTLLGIYSGRINDQSDLGRVFTVSAVRDMLSGQ